MADQDRVQTARSVVDAFNTSDWDGTLKLLGNGVYNEIGTQRRLQGDELIEALKSWKQAMPDVKGTVTGAVAGDNQVVLELTWRGTQTGPLVTPGGTVPASGKSQATPAAWVFDFAGDEIKESRQYFDMMSFMQQIGAMPQ